MDWDEFSHWGAKIADWGAGYHKGLRDQPVRPNVQPGDIKQQLPSAPPEEGCEMNAIMADFEQIVMPGVTHWQHPRFFAYFPGNATPPSMLADFLSSTIAAQCMLWQTCPSGTEMEEVMIDWLRQALGLPDGFSGVIQDSASSATLAAVLAIRERALSFEGNSKGLAALPQVRIYASDEGHTSITRAIWVAGIGQDNLVRIPTKGPLRAMDAAALDTAIQADKDAGLIPAGIIAVTGATGVGSCDNIGEVIEVAEKHDLYTHVDAAWAGAAMICPEFRELWSGVEGADSIVFNPHKWMGAQFDCAAHFIRDPDTLRGALAIRPEYLKTTGEGFTDFSEWSIPLGRRFRALKLWFLMRTYGLEGLREMFRNHVRWSQALCERLRAEPDFKITSEPVLSLWSFQYKDIEDQQMLVDAINTDGRIYLTQTNLDGQKVIRMQVGQFNCTEEDVMDAFTAITQVARGMT